MLKSFVTVVVVLSCITTAWSEDSKKLVVHEWGTFTSLQDETGQTIGGINSDDEPVPKFVHNLLPLGLVGGADIQRYNHDFQGWPRAAMPVTMRLETPVLYIYPGEDWVKKDLHVTVNFKGGFLTQFYPNATPNIVPPRDSDITASTIGRLDWPAISVNSGAPIPQTDEHVWLTPRKPDSATLTEHRTGESEKYLFYRGVGHVDAPLRISRTDDRLAIETRAEQSFEFNDLWYCQFRADGSCAWQRVAALKSGQAASVSADFHASDFSEDNLAGLRADMKKSLIAAGLYPTEADAMLETWELSYFKSWGSRLFYLVPPQWTEATLPLQINPAPTEIKRAMIGRIDLITPAHRALLSQIAAATDVKSQDDHLWTVYERLGRFRNALLLEAEAHTPAPALTQFITAHGLDSTTKP